MPSYKLASIPRYDDIVRTAGCAGSARIAGRRPASDGGRPQNRAPHTGSGRCRPAGYRPPTGAVLNITAAVWNAGFHSWRSGNKKRTQNVSEYMLVLALCLVVYCHYNYFLALDRALYFVLTHMRTKQYTIALRIKLRVENADVATTVAGNRYCLILYETRNVGQCPTCGRPAEHRWRPLFNAAKFG